VKIHDAMGKFLLVIQALLLNNRSFFIYEKYRRFYSGVRGNLPDSVVRESLRCLKEGKRIIRTILSDEQYAGNKAKIPCVKRIKTARVMECLASNHHVCELFFRFYG
jgi:hypothetical protein